MRRLNAAGMMDRLGIRSRTTLEKYIKNGLIPPPMRDSDNGRRYWAEGDEDPFIKSQIERRNASMQIEAHTHAAPA